MWFRVVALSLALSLPVAAQRTTPTGPGSRGSGNVGPGSSIPGIGAPRTTQTLMVRITTEQEMPISSDVRVQLTSSAGVPITEVFAHEGMAQFEVQPGNYRLRVTGNDIEDTTSDSFTVSSFEPASMQFVRVKMRPLAGASGSTQGTVSTYELNVPEKAKAELRKGDAELAHQQWKKAIPHLEKAIAIYPQYAGAYNDLGVACIKTGDTARARQSFEKAVEFNEHTGTAYLNLARFSLMDKNFPETIRLANKSLSLNPNQPEALLILADSEYATGQYASAVVHARKVHDLAHERYALSHMIAAAALEAQQKPAEAAAEYEKFLKEDPNSPRAPAARQALNRLSAAASGPTPKP